MLGGFAMSVSEIWKQYYMTEILNHGVYNWWYFPFQLCSVPMYLLLLLPLCRHMRRKSQKKLFSRTKAETLFARLYDIILMSLACYGLLGGIAVFADTSGLHYPVLPLTVHSYLWHILMIAEGGAAGLLLLGEYARQENRICSRTDLPHSSYPRRGRLPFRLFADSTALYFACCMTAEILNIIFGHFGRINLFYINPQLPMTQVVFRGFVPYIGNAPTILLYIAATVFGAFLLFCVWNFAALLRQKHFA
jgi:hypothetical protein